VFAAFPYAGAAERAIGALKFRHSPGVAGEMAELMWSRLPEWARAAAWIVPVPAHPARLRARGYNQSLVLAQALAKLGPPGVADCLRRAPIAPPQSELTRSGRLRLPVEAFTVDDRALRRLGLDSADPLPPGIILLDDVMTTGTTLERCSEALASRQAAPISLAEFPTNVAGWVHRPTKTITLGRCTQATREHQPETGKILIPAVTFASAG
jgi:predicted amidophosphoribosyltransferase